MNYREEMLRTLSPKGDLYEHALYGLVTEAAEALDTLKKVKFYGQEFDKVHALEELGDIRWYVELVCYVIGFNDLELKKHKFKSEDTYEKEVGSLIFYASDLLLSQERWSSSMDRRHDVESTVNGFYKNIDCAAHAIGYTMEDVERANIAKLKKRYPEKWTEDKAMNRDLETERKTLEEQA